jgi:hypothetical protein
MLHTDIESTASSKLTSTLRSRRRSSASKDLSFPFLPSPFLIGFLHSPELQFNIVLPLEEHLVALGEVSVVYVLLLVRLQFVRESTAALASHSLNQSRAALCELLAVKLLRHQASTVKGSAQGMLAMGRALVGGFQPFQGASEEVSRSFYPPLCHLLLPFPFLQY